MNSVIFLLVAHYVAAPAPASEAEKATEKLQGTWTLVAMEAKGEKVSNEKVTEMNIVFEFKGNKLVIKNDDEKLDHYSFTLDPTKAPAHIDLKDLGERAREGICHAIYSIDDRQLKVCLGTNFNPDELEERPKEFATVEGSANRPPKGKYLFVLQKREK